MARITMRQIREGEVPFDGGTALQEDPERPVFSGNGPNDYVCVQCGNVLAAGMDPEYMTKKVRVKCGVCRTVNVAITDESPAGDPRLKWRHGH
jgi:phage FluMu protein Com